MIVSKKYVSNRQSGYQDIQKLKRIADQHNITVLLVHHLRKQGDRDPVNRLSGTTGISGAVDAVFVLDRKERAQNAALLVCTGRDVEYRELELRFSRERCVWDLVSDSAEKPEQLLPQRCSMWNSDASAASDATNRPHILASLASLCGTDRVQKAAVTKP